MIEHTPARTGMCFRLFSSLSRFLSIFYFGVVPPRDEEYFRPTSTASIRYEEQETKTGHRRRQSSTGLADGHSLLLCLNRRLRKLIHNWIW